MSELVLEPFAAQQLWQLSAPQPDSSWQEILSAYLGRLARACESCAIESGRRPIIGHVKLLALLPDRGYLRIGAVSAHHPVICSGRVPDGLSEITLTLNVLVYGVSRDVLEKLTREIAQEVAVECGAEVRQLSSEVLPSVKTDDNSCTKPA